MAASSLPARGSRAAPPWSCTDLLRHGSAGEGGGAPAELEAGAEQEGKRHAAVEAERRGGEAAGRGGSAAAPDLAKLEEARHGASRARAAELQQALPVALEEQSRGGTPWPAPALR